MYLFRSNPNILDLIPPPPPLYAPPSLPGEPAPSSAPNTRHSRQRRDSDTSEYFTQVHSTVQCSTVQYSTVQYNRIEYNTVQYSTQ